MGQSLAALVIIVGIVKGLAVAFGAYQVENTQARTDACQVPSRDRRLVHLAVGILIATSMTVMGALRLGSWAIVPACGAGRHPGRGRAGPSARRRGVTPC